MDQAINKEFMIDDTAMATKQITSKLDILEKIVKNGPKRMSRRDWQKLPTENSLSSMKSKDNMKKDIPSDSSANSLSKKRFEIKI